MSRRGPRWFPGPSDITISPTSGWLLSGGERWNTDEPDAEPVALFLVLLEAPDRLRLSFRLNDQSERHLVFDGLVDLRIDGPLFTEEPDWGWEVMDMCMLEASSFPDGGRVARDDGRVVYDLGLVHAGICFASWVGSVE